MMRLRPRPGLVGHSSTQENYSHLGESCRNVNGVGFSGVSLNVPASTLGWDAGSSYLVTRRES